MFCVAFEVCLVTLPQNEGFIFLCNLDWVFGSLSISACCGRDDTYTGGILHIQEEFPSPLIKVEGVFWLFILMVIKCLSNLFKKYFSTSMILLMCWIPAPTLIKPIFAKN